uniref:Ribosomal protein L16 n=1 Tax=Storeatula sp. CCMP1868 TaxID=195070 RepID=A0A2P1G877_9CRYP|nr:ribosomal protein L16 [Storeatula sp. CCMP1868]AVM81168.1 ribosomal protein L16 [Storeatula sp. CCMP1868]
MLFPKKTKFKKSHQKCFRTKETTNLSLSKGNFGLKATQNKETNAKQIESVKKFFIKKSNRTIKIWVNIFPHLPKTKKPLEVRMGKGKGNVEYWYSFVKTGKIVFEFDNLNKSLKHTIQKSGVQKLPFKTKLIFKKF